MRFLTAPLLALTFAGIQPISAQDSIRIGVVNSSNAVTNQLTLGANAGIDHLNSSGGIIGKPVELIEFDDSCDPSKAIDIAQKLVDTERVNAVVGHPCDDAADAAARIYETQDIPFLTFSSLPSLTERHDVPVTTFRVCGRHDYQADLTVTYLLQQFSPETIAGIFSDTEYGTIAQHRISEWIPEDNILSTAELTTADQLLNRVIEQNAKAVMLYGLSPKLTNSLIDRARTREVTAHFVFDGVVLNSSLRDSARSELHGIALSTNCYMPVLRVNRDTVPNPTLLEVVQTQLENQADWEIGYALHTFAAIEILAMATSTAGTTETTKVVEALKSGIFDTVVGQIDFDTRGDVLVAVNDSGYVASYFYQRFMFVEDMVVHWTEDDPCPEDDDD